MKGLRAIIPLRALYIFGTVKKLWCCISEEVKHSNLDLWIVWLLFEVITVKGTVLR